MGAMTKTIALWAALAVALAGCGSSDAYSDEDAQADAAADAAAEAAYSAYAERGADSDGTGADPDTVDASDVEDAGDYACTQDCSGHEAGFQWAQEQNATDSSDCGGNSQSFIEGCEAFVEARQEQADQEAQEAGQAAADAAAEDAEYESEAD